MLTPGRRSRRSILTPTRSSTSRVASPAPDKIQVLTETSQYKVLTQPSATHSIARDVIRRGHVTSCGVSHGLGYVSEDNRVIAWNMGTGRMFELLVPARVFSVYLTESKGAVVVTVHGDVVRWSRVDQTQRYSLQHSALVGEVVDTELHDGTVLLLDSTHNVWVSEEAGLNKLNPSSALSGLSRRVSSMFWRAPETQLGDPLKVVSCSDVIFVVGTRGVQRIHGSAVTWTAELKQLISNSPDNIHIVDALCTDSTLVCLVEMEGELSLVSLSPHHATVPQSVDSVLHLQQVESAKDLKLKYQPGTNRTIVYSDRKCNLVTPSNGAMVTVALDDVTILGVVTAASDLLIVTRQHGIVKVVVKDVKAAVSNLNIPTDQEDGYKSTERKFLSAYQCFIEFNETQQQDSLQEILGCEDEELISRLVVELGDHLISAAPAADPRWGGQDAHLPVTLGLQIEERIRRLKGLIQFLVVTGFFERLLTKDSTIGSTLLQYVEKCLVAKVFCGSQCGILQRAINESAALFRANNNTTLTSEDLVFSKIERIEVTYSTLAAAQNEILSSKAESAVVIQDLFASVEVIQQSFDGVLSWRADSHQLYQLVKTETWCDTDEIRAMIALQVQVAMETVLPEVNENNRYQVLIVTASLVESVLKLYEDLISRLPQHDARAVTLQAEYDRKKEALIRPFVVLKVHQIAFTLAEQFQHFTLLIELCDETRDTDKLRALSAAHPGFAEVAYNWYLSQGKQSTLLTANVADPARLTKFLTSQPHLKWIHQLGNKQYSTAGRTLANLGTSEKELVSRKKTLLSVSKLACLAGEEEQEDQVAAIDRELEIITHQERMKPEVIENAGLVPEHMAPISCADLIRLCVSDYNSNLEDIDVKKAIDLLQCAAEDEAISNDTFEGLRLEIWTSVIGRDEWWLGKSLSSPDKINETLFYRAVILAYNSGMLVSHFLPNIEQLLASNKWTELFTDEAHFKQFEYILRSGYEQMSNLGLVSH